MHIQGRKTLWTVQNPLTTIWKLSELVAWSDFQALPFQPHGCTLGTNFGFASLSLSSLILWISVNSFLTEAVGKFLKLTRHVPVRRKVSFFCEVLCWNLSKFLGSHIEEKRSIACVFYVLRIHESCVHCSWILLNRFVVMYKELEMFAVYSSLPELYLVFIEN